MGKKEEENDTVLRVAASYITFVIAGTLMGVLSDGSFLISLEYSAGIIGMFYLIGFGLYLLSLLDTRKDTEAD